MKQSVSRKPRILQVTRWSLIKTIWNVRDTYFHMFFFIFEKLLMSLFYRPLKFHFTNVLHNRLSFKQCFLIKTKFSFRYRSNQTSIHIQQQQQQKRDENGKLFQKYHNDNVFWSKYCITVPTKTGGKNMRKPSLWMRSLKTSSF